MNKIKRYLNRLLYKLADKYLTKTDFQNLIFYHDHKDFKEMIKESEKQRIAMKKFLAEKGEGFINQLEKQDHTATLISGPSHHKSQTPKMMNIKEL